MKYPEKFYIEVVNQNDALLSKFAIWRGKIVGAICTRLSEGDQADHGKELYIMTLAVLAAYRDRGIGSQLLQSILDGCQQRGICMISLHVHILNEDAVRFYTDRFGFQKGELIKNYYRRLDPPHCYILTKQIESPSEEAQRIPKEGEENRDAKRSLAKRN